MDKNAREKKNLYEWACKHTGTEGPKYFTGFSKEQETYFSKRTEMGHMMEYGFETAGELKNLLQDCWNNEPVFDEILPTILVAVSKNKASAEKDCIQNDKGKDELPTFIYNF